MSRRFSEQHNVLQFGITAFEPVINKLHRAYRDEAFGDWPTIVLATTLQVSAISLFRLLPAEERTDAPLDRRSIASIIRNIIETHDALDLLIGTASPDEFNLHRDIMGLYLSARIEKIGSSISPDRPKSIFGSAASGYWESIKRSPLYTKSMDRLKTGESLFYLSRAERVRKACGSDSDFVMGVIADLSTYVHSVPPTLWMSGIDEIYKDDERNRDVVAVWLALTTLYLAQSFNLVLKIFPTGQSGEIGTFLAARKTLFAEKRADGEAR